MSEEISVKRKVLKAAPGDVLFSRHSMPVPEIILTGFDAERRFENEQPEVNLNALQGFLELLEFVVLTERLVVPIPQFQPETIRLIEDEEFEFMVYRVVGNLSYDTEALLDRLGDAGVLCEAQIDVGCKTADDVIAQLLPVSKALRAHCAKFSEYARGYGDELRTAIVNAKMAVRIGAPLHVALAAGRARVPYVLDGRERRYVESYERESLRSRKTVGRMLLDRINASARREVSQLINIGVPTVFPETPIASMILHSSATPAEMVDVALQLRDQFASFRHHLNGIEHDLANEDQSLKVRLKRVRELERLAASLWPKAKTDLCTSAVNVADALLAIPELAAAPSPEGASKMIERLAQLPLDVIMDAFRRRKVRLFIKARHAFLHNRDATDRISKVLNVPASLVRESRSRAARIAMAIDD